MISEVNKVRLTVLIALMFSALCAGVFRTPPILFMAALLTSSPFVGWVVGRLASRKLQIARTVPETGTVGDTITGEISVTNQARVPAFLVHIRCGASCDAKTGVADGALVPAGGEEQVLPMLRRSTRAVWQQSWQLKRRGVHTLSPARTGVLDPLGLSSRLRIQSPAQTVTVLPRPIRIEQLGFWGGAGLEQQAPHHSTIVADAMDFHGVRPWLAGEAIRRAHWKYTARTGQLHVIEWEETPAADLAVLLDAHAAAVEGDDNDNTLETAITVTASIAAYLLENGCRFQLFYFVEEDVPGRRPNQAPRLQLKAVCARSVEGLDVVLRALAEVKSLQSTFATASHLIESALPQVGRGLGTLLIASSSAMRDGLPQHGAKGSRLQTFLIDAESYKQQPLAGTEPEQRAPVPSHGRPAVARHHNAPRRHEMLLRKGEPIGAALEGQW
jgi:uncharacterized protein (DUF58 family)